ncbi:MAG TPA: winged helix-turn-helix domain-containing protein [Candidatus Limnocylindrales bacterium]|nr:winged helix-turn-helix domain-containing protein [Candidatus Limnocylindrales bacterium]
MIYRFGQFELDTAAVELRAAGQARPLEPQVFRLLALLLENHERMVSKDELIEKVWDGRAISDAALSSRIKSARRALGDDGKAQRLIKTLHGRGFRFVGDVRAERQGGSVDAVADATAGVASTAAATAAGDALAAGARAVASAASTDEAATGDSPATAHASRPSIAVLPFRFLGSPGAYEPLAEAIPHELIAELSRMRWLFVIARASSFRLRGNEDAGEIRRLLGARYVLSGTLELARRAHLAVRVELTDTVDGGVVWAEELLAPLDDVHAMRARLASCVVTALEIRIPLHEAEKARLAVSEHLDAWLSYHLGLQHMYRFNKRDNQIAAALFAQAITRDPGFARAHGGLSFVHFQTAFLRHTENLEGERALARQFAERAVELDPLDPFVNFTMGRTYWLDGDLDRSRGWLERAVAMSPNYAQGIYALGWTDSLAGHGLEGRAHVDMAMRLSPLDPLFYAMLGTRSFSHMVRGEDAEAATWAERAARAPGAHVLIPMIAVAAHGLAGNDARAAYWAGDVRARNAALTRADFFRAFPMQHEAARERVAHALERRGF